MVVRSLVVALMLLALPAGAVTIFNDGGWHFFNATTDSGVIVTGGSTVDVVAPASLTEPGASCDTSSAAALCVGTRDEPGFVEVRSGLVESAVLLSGYIGVSDGVLGSVQSPSDNLPVTVHIFGGEVGAIDLGHPGSVKSLRVFGGTIGSVLVADHSHVEVFGGSINGVDALIVTSVSITGGDITGTVSVGHESSLLIDGGTFHDTVSISDASTLTIDGGTFTSAGLAIDTESLASVVLSGGAFEAGATILVERWSRLYVNGTNLSLSEPRPVNGVGLGANYESFLTGELLDGTPISVDVLFDPSSFHTTITLNGLGLCQNGLDDDGDGVSDYPGDPGCWDASDPSEREHHTVGALPCDDGLDNDGDGLIDYVVAGGGDPGCASPTSTRENPQCQDGLNNDFHLGIDFDGGASHDLDHDGRVDAQFNLAIPLVGTPDPQCTAGWMNKEKLGGCGLGFELVFLAPLLARLRSRREAAR